MVTKLPVKNKQTDRLNTYADTYLEFFARGMELSNGNSSGLGYFLLIVFIVFLLFLLMPTLNLVNINISRIMERSSEIGVRKAFGASSRTLVVQFIIENLILTFIGGAIGIVLSFFIIRTLNGNGLIFNIHLAINFNVLFYSLAACVFFGLLSGVYPAWRMSRLHVVTALKGQ